MAAQNPDTVIPSVERSPSSDEESSVAQSPAPAVAASSSANTDEDNERKAQLAEYQQRLRQACQYLAARFPAIKSKEWLRTKVRNRVQEALKPPFKSWSSHSLNRRFFKEWVKNGCKTCDLVEMLSAMGVHTVLATKEGDEFDYVMLREQMADKIEVLLGSNREFGANKAIEFQWNTMKAKARGLIPPPATAPAAPATTPAAASEPAALAVQPPTTPSNPQQQARATDSAQPRASPTVKRELSDGEMPAAKMPRREPSYGDTPVNNSPASFAQPMRQGMVIYNSQGCQTEAMLDPATERGIQGCVERSIEKSQTLDQKIAHAAMLGIHQYFKSRQHQQQHHQQHQHHHQHQHQHQQQQMPQPVTPQYHHTTPMSYGGSASGPRSNAIGTPEQEFAPQLGPRPKTINRRPRYIPDDEQEYDH